MLRFLVLWAMAIRRQWFYLLAASLIIVITMSLAGRGLLAGYSYWLDEILSVSASMGSWRDLYSNYVLSGDINPPLYLSMLKVWVGVVGDSEVATRLLSFVFAGVALLVLAYEACRSVQARWLVSLLLLGISPAFAYFSQETRTYSLSLVLATWVTVAALRLREVHLVDQETGARAWTVGYYVGCFALSFSHYFGWIYVFVFIIIDLFERLVEPARWKSLFCWRLFQYGLYGMLWRVTFAARLGEAQARQGRSLGSSEIISMDACLRFRLKSLPISMSSHGDCLQQLF